MIYLLDTNVISETTKRQPHPRIQNWLEAHPLEETGLSVVTIGEIAQGIMRSPPERQLALQSWFQQIKTDFAHRILPLGLEVMETWGNLTGQAFNQGKVIPPVDALLAATALHHGLVLVTRNTRDFVGLPIALLDPSQGG